MRVDEAATWLYFSSKSVFYGLVSYTLPNNHIFHTVLVSACTFIFANHPWAIRLPAFLAGVALIPLSYAAAKRFYGEAAAMITAAFVASSSVLVEFSTNARGYTIVAAIFLALIVLAPSHDAEPRAWWRFAVLSAIGFLTIPTMLFPFGVVVAWLALSIARAQDVDRAALAKRLVRTVLLTIGLTAIAYLPAIVWSGPHAVFANRFVTSKPWSVFSSTIGPSLGSTWMGWHRDLGVAGAIVFAFLFAVGFARDKTRLVLVAVAWSGVLLLVERWVPFHRVWTFLIPVYWMTAAAGIVVLLRRQRWAAPLSIALCLSIGGSVLASGSVLRSPDTGYFPDAERVAVSLRALGAGDKVLAYNPATVPLLYYARLHHQTLLLGSPASADRRIFIVVDSAVGQTLGQLAQRFASARFPAGMLEQATLYQRFARAAVYIFVVKVG
jgi:4-amino-4-deoxy-L-arabinose transferase-like glycosyltransferase